jgi:hypothetical protein
MTNDVANVDVTLLPLGGCGDGSIEAGEECDGANLGGLGSADLGYTGGPVTGAGRVFAFFGGGTVDTGVNGALVGMASGDWLGIGRL